MTEERYRYTEDNSFDFPCSRTFRAFEAEYNEGIRLPPTELPQEEKPQEVQFIPARIVTRDQYEQQRRMILNLQRKVNELTERKKDTNYIYNNINKESDAQA